MSQGPSNHYKINTAMSIIKSSYEEIARLQKEIDRHREAIAGEHLEILNIVANLEVKAQVNEE